MNKFFVVVGNFWHLIVKDVKFVMAASVALSFTITGTVLNGFVEGDNISEPLQTVLISLTIACYVYLAGALLTMIVNAVRYIKFSGRYTGYAYKSTDKNKPVNYYTRQDTPQSNATLEYLGGENFKIKIDADVLGSDLTWSGDFKMVSSNMAEIAWWYTNDHLRDAVGYKRAVIIKDDKCTRIVLFSNDGSIHERELFVKNC
jgi:hypothetical protein